MASLKAIRQQWKEGTDLIWSEQKESQKQLNNATLALTQAVGLATDIKKEKDEKAELDEFAEKNDMQYDKRTGRYYGADPDDPKNQVYEIDEAYMKALKDNPALYEDSPKELIFKDYETNKETGEVTHGGIKDAFAVKDDFSVDVKKKGIGGWFERVIPGGETGYDTLGKHDVRVGLPEYQDWYEGKGIHAEVKTLNPDFDESLEGKYVTQKSKDDPTLVESKKPVWNPDKQEWEGGGIAYESLVPKHLTKGGAQYTSFPGGLNIGPDAVKGGLNLQFGDKRDILAPKNVTEALDKASASLESIAKEVEFKSDLTFGATERGKDYTRKLDESGNIIEEADWDRLSADLNAWEGPQGDKLNVTPEGLKNMAKNLTDDNISRWMEHSGQVEQVKTKGLKGATQRIMPFGESGYEFDDRARINAAVGILKNFEDRSDWDFETHEIFADDTAQSIYDYFQPSGEPRPNPYLKPDIGMPVDEDFKTPDIKAPEDPDEWYVYPTPGSGIKTINLSELDTFDYNQYLSGLHTESLRSLKSLSEAPRREDIQFKDTDYYKSNIEGGDRPINNEDIAAYRAHLKHLQTEYDRYMEPAGPAPSQEMTLGLGGLFSEETTKAVGERGEKNRTEKRQVETW